MIDKQEFYHGAAIVRLLEDPRCQKIQKQDFGYLVNNRVFLFLKYTSKSRSPWRFTFSRDEITRIDAMVQKYDTVVIGFVCAGDGICAVTWQDAIKILGASDGWISVKRNFNQQYAVAGPVQELHGKISRRQWPSIAFCDQKSDVEAVSA